MMELREVFEERADLAGVLWFIDRGLDWGPVLMDHGCFLWLELV